MRVLLAVPHYFRPGGRHGSGGPDPAPRLAALTACLTSVREVLAPRACVLAHAGRQAVRLPAAVTVDVVVCTAGADHLLDRLDPADRAGLTYRPTAADPPLLGYECHAALRDGLGRYNLFGYLEDDILITDPWLPHKLLWFTRTFGPNVLLQPNRYEAGRHPLVDKMYVDGDLPPHVAAGQLAPHPHELAAEAFGRPVRFTTTTNPHAGCFFLTAEQMAKWVAAPSFLDRSAAFVGPLESAATLGVMRTFAVYKASRENPDFLEVRHSGADYLKLVVGEPG